MKDAPCIEYAKANGPAKDDGLAWCINLARVLKESRFSLEKAAMHLSRLSVAGECDSLDDEDILTFCRTAWSSERLISCTDLIRCKSFSAGCPEEHCPAYEPQTIPPDDGPTLLHVSLADPPGTVGVDPSDGQVKIRKSVSKKDGSTVEVLSWISDCPIGIHTETIAEKQREFIFQGVGAADKLDVRFCMPAEDLADPRKFKAAMINGFGAANRFGNMTFEISQQISKNIIRRRRLLAPAWVDERPMVPGIGFTEDIEYRLLEMIPVAVYDGDLEAAKETLSKLLDVPGPTMILVTAILGSPIYARWFLNDRFGVGMWGRTGSMKTSITKKAMCIYGIGYNDDANLLKHGKSGSTAVGELEVLAGAGFLPQIIDNVKSVDPRDAQQYIATIHAVIEGKDKVRGKKDGGVRNSKPFFCTPIITGEIKPDEASTSARIFNLKWEEPKNKAEIDYVQAHISQLPVIGYHWLRYLATVQDPSDGFNEARSRKTDEFNKQNYVNSGRLATIYALLRATWNLLCRSPLADVFEQRTEKFLKLLDAAAADQGATVSEETEVAKFMAGIKAILTSQPHLIQEYENQTPDEYGKTYFKDVIGRWIETKDGGVDLFLVPEPALFALKRLNVFTQIPSKGSMTDALAQSDFIRRGKKTNMIRQRMNGHLVYGWLLRGENFKDDPKDKMTLDGLDEET